MKANLSLTLLCLVALLFTQCNGNKLAKENEAIAQSFIEAWNSHDAEKLISLFSDEFQYNEVASGRSFTNNEALTSYFERTIAGIPDTKFEVISIFANDNYAAVEWIWKGTNSVGWDYMGIPATGKTIELPGVSVMEIVNGKIIRNSDYWDWNSFMQSIGVAPQ